MSRTAFFNPLLSETISRLHLYPIAHNSSLKVDIAKLIEYQPVKNLAFVTIVQSSEQLKHEKLGKMTNVFD